MDARRPPRTPGSLGCLRRLKNGSSSEGPGWQEVSLSNLSHQRSTKLSASPWSQRPTAASNQGSRLSVQSPLPLAPPPHRWLFTAQLPRSHAGNRKHTHQIRGRCSLSPLCTNPVAFLSPPPPRHHPQRILRRAPFSLDAGLLSNFPPLAFHLTNFWGPTNTQYDLLAWPSQTHAPFPPKQLR